MTSGLSTATAGRREWSTSTDEHRQGIKHRQEHFDSQGFCICSCAFCIKLDGTCVCQDCECRRAAECQGEDAGCYLCRPWWVRTFSDKKKA